MYTFFLSLSNKWRSFLYLSSLEKSLPLSILRETRADGRSSRERTDNDCHRLSLITHRANRHWFVDPWWPRRYVIPPGFGVTRTMRTVSSSDNGLETTAAPLCTIGHRGYRDACAEPKIFKTSLWHFSRHCDPRCTHAVSLTQRPLSTVLPFIFTLLDASREFPRVQLVARSNQVDRIKCSHPPVTDRITRSVSFLRSWDSDWNSTTINSSKITWSVWKNVLA